MPEPALEVQDLRHSFKGHQALAGVTFSVPAGALHGFVGPNGAGKTTTLKIIATLLRPQQGRVRVLGSDVVGATRRVRGVIGFMPDHFSMYKNMTVYEYLEFFAAAHGLHGKKRRSIVDDVLALTDMDVRQHDMIKGLSRGMQQRVSLARVLVNDPQLLLLDEPASGLDPRARIELMEILRELSRMGKTIFISSHILSELADLCDSVTIIDRGEIRYSGEMTELLTHEGDQRAMRLVLTEPRPELAMRLRALPGVDSVDDSEAPRYLVRFDRATVSNRLLLETTLAADGEVESFTEDLRHLNQVFMDLTEPGVRS